MTIILFIIVVVLLFWVGSLSSRIERLEKSGATFKRPREDERPPKPVLTPEDYKNLESHKASAAAAGASAPSYAAPAFHPQSPAAPAHPSVPMSPYGWLTKFGMLAIALGIVFFYKYAIDQGWISEWMRVIFGFAVGGLFVYLGELWKNKYEKYSFAISGGGILILGFTIYAAFNFYHLLPQPISLALMVAVSALAVWLSVQRKSLTLAVLGIIGAYGAPLLLSTGQNQQGLLFSYLMILNLAVVAVLWRKFWLQLALLGFVASLFDFGVWAGQFSGADNTWGSVMFVVLSSILFVPVLAMFFRRHATLQTLPEEADKGFGLFSLLAGLYYFVSIDALLNNTSFALYLPLLILLGAIIWWVSYLLVDRLNFNFTNHSLSFAGTFLVASAAYWQFSGRTFDAVLIAIAVVSAIIGYLVKRSEFNTWGIITLYIALLVVSFHPYKPGDEQFLLNGKFALMLLETAALVFASWLSGKSEMAEKQKSLQTLTEIVAAVLLWLAVSVDINHAYNGLGASQGMALWWVLLPAALAFVAYLGKRSVLGIVALVLLFLGALDVLILPYDSGSYVFLANAKFGLMLLMTIAFLAVAALQSPSSENPKDVNRDDLLKVSAALFLWFAVSWEIVQYFSLGGSENARNLLLSVWWIVYGAALMAVSSVKSYGLYRKVAMLFFGLAIAKVFLYDVLALETGYRIVSFIVLGVILLSVSFAYQKNKEKIKEFLEGEKKENSIS